MQALSILEGADKKFVEITNNLALQGYLMHHFHHATSQNAHHAIAWLLYLYLRANPGATQQGNVHSSPAGYQQLTALLSDPKGREEVVKDFVGLLGRTNSLSFLLKILDSAPSSAKFIAASISSLADSEQIANLFTADVLESRAVFLRTIVDAGKRKEGVVDRITKRLIEGMKLIESTTAKPFEVNKAWLYSSMVRGGAYSNDSFIRWCEAGCVQVTKEIWLKELSSEGDLAELVHDLIEKGARINLGISYLDAIAEHGDSMARGKVVPKYFSKSWTMFLDPLAEHARNTLRDRLLDAAKNNGGKTSAALFDNYGVPMGDVKTLYSDQRVVSTLFSPLVTERNEPGLIWLSGLFRTHGNFLAGYTPDYAMEDLKERLSNAIGAQGLGDSVRASITTIASALNIGLVESDKPDSESTKQ